MSVGGLFVRLPLARLYFSPQRAVSNMNVSAWLADFPSSSQALCDLQNFSIANYVVAIQGNCKVYTYNV